MASRRLAALHLFFCLADAKHHMRREPSTVTEISPSSITAKMATEISFTGVGDGDKVQFALDCKQLSASGWSTVQKGKAKMTIEDEAEQLKLCYQASKSENVEEQAGISLAVVQQSGSSVVTAITPSQIVQGEAVTITLTGAPAFSKAIFIPVKDECKDAVPRISLDLKSRGLFTVNSVGGKYKLCYQAPGGSDSVEQMPKDSTIVLTVEQAVMTNEEQITAISPASIVSNVATSIQLSGAKAGDKAKFVNPETSSCEQEAPPDKDVGTGHGSFTVSGAGTYVLCYTAKGAADSVQQKGVTLTVKAAGAAQNMLGRWSSKNGNLDCASLAQVPYCSSSGIANCDKTYAIQSGIGYKCFWNTAKWPPLCDVDMNTEDRGTICQSNSCGGSPSMCW